MAMKLQKVLLMLVFALLFSATAFAAETVYWLRGNASDIALYLDTEHRMISTAPGSGATEADFTTTTVAGTNDWGVWHSDSLAENFTITGTVYVWFSYLNLSGGSGQFRWTLWDYDEESGSITYIAQSAWADFPSAAQIETFKTLDNNYTVAAGNRLGLRLEYNSASSGSTASLKVDSASAGSSVTWNASTGGTYTASNVSRAAAILFNPQTVSISCSSDSDCDDSNSLTGDVCINSGTAQSFCSNQGCYVACYSSSDCDDGVAETVDTCLGAGTCSSRCQNLEEFSALCSSNSDCDDGNPLTIDSCNNPGTASAGCSNISCTPTCSSSSDCDDSDANTTDVCAGAGRCTATCSNLASCGNGVLDSGETPCNCPTDAGTCEGIVGTCLENACIGTSCEVTIALGCCGNNFCEFKEDYSNCAVDCKPKEISIEVTGISEESSFLRGEEVKLVAAVEADGLEVREAKVFAKGFFGEIVLFNDGKHSDGTRNDNLYGNSFFVGETLKEGTYPVTIEASFAGSTGKTVKNLNFKPALEVSIATDREAYALGDIIRVSGTITKKGKGIAREIDLNISVEGKLVTEADLNSKADGSYSFEYHSSNFEDSGSWEISILTSDEQGNIGAKSKNVVVAEQEITASLSLELEREILAAYARNETIAIEVRVKNLENKLVEQASVQALMPDGEIVSFAETSTGLYGAAYLIKPNVPLGEQEIKVVASKFDGNNVMGGSLAFIFEVKAISLIVEVLEPTNKSVQVGEDLKIRVAVSYPDNEPVVGADFNALVNGKKVELKAVEKGVYEGTHFIDESEAQGIKAAISFDDSFGNKGTAGFEVDVRGTSIVFYLKKYTVSIALAFLAAALAATLIALQVMNRNRYAGFKRKEKELIEKLKNIQVQYFREGSLDRKNYDQLMQKYEAGLEEARKTIAQMEKEKKK